MKWKAVKIRQELVQEVEKQVQKGDYRSLSEFVSEAIRNRLQISAKQTVSKYLERDKAIRDSQSQKGRFYTTKHVWANFTAKNVVEVGVTRFFQEQIREIVNIRTEKVGTRIFKGKPFGMAESWWFTHDLNSPLNGKILDINEDVIADPFTLNYDTSQWIIKIKPRDIKAWKDGLLTPEKYAEAISQLSTLEPIPKTT